MAGARAAGLDIGTSAVRAAEVSLPGGRVRVHRFGEVPLPDGAMRDGEIVDAGAVTAAVKRLWRSGGFKTRRVAVSVGNRRVVVRQVDLPWLPADEMRAALQFQAQDLLPMPVEDAILDFHRLEEFVGDAGARLVRVMLVAADARMVRAAVDVVRGAGLRPEVVDLTPFALLRAVTMLDPLDPELAATAQTEAVVDVGAAVTNILVHCGGRPRFVRILMQGGLGVTDSVSEHLGVPLHEAEAVKFVTPMRGVEDAAAPVEPAARAVEFAAAAFVEEVRGSLDYYRAQSGAAPLARIVLSGGGSRLGNLAERLGAATRLPVHRAAAFVSLEVPQQRASDDAPATGLGDVATVPVGLALRMAS